MFWKSSEIQNGKLWHLEIPEVNGAVGRSYMVDPQFQCLGILGRVQWRILNNGKMTVGHLPSQVWQWKWVIPQKTKNDGEHEGQRQGFSGTPMSDNWKMVIMNPCHILVYPDWFKRIGGGHASEVSHCFRGSNSSLWIHSEAHTILIGFLSELFTEPPGMNCFRWLSSLSILVAGMLLPTD